MLKRDICAFTEPGLQPGYCNVSQNEDGSYVVTVRGTGEQFGQSITIPEAKMRHLSDDLHYQFHNGAGG